MRHVRFKLLAVLGAAFVLSLAAVGPAQAHFLGYDSVDDCEIRWEDETSYDTERIHAQEQWEALKNYDFIWSNVPTETSPDYSYTLRWDPDDCVDLAPDSFWTNADLEWKDANRSDVSWFGLYENEFGADDIHLNKYYLDTFTSCERKKVATHELGHAHGLGHSYSGNVMKQGKFCQSSLGPHDKYDYDVLWG